MVENERSLLSINRAARLAGYSRRHLMRLLERDSIRCFDVAGLQVIFAMEFYAWIRGRGKHVASKGDLR